MIEPKQLLSINYYKKGKPFTGSDTGMRYRIAKISVEIPETEGDTDISQKEGEKGADDKKNKKEDRFLVSVWPEPYCYEKTDKEKIIERTFPYSEEEFNGFADYLNGMHDSVSPGK